MQLSIERSMVNEQQNPQYQMNPLITLMKSSKMLSTQNNSEKSAEHITNRRDHSRKKREGKMVEEWKLVVRWMTSSMHTFI